LPAIANHGFSNRDQTERFDKGFLPVSIVFGKTLDGNPRKGSIWHRELETEQLSRREQRIANAFCYALLHGEDIGIWRILSNPTESALKQRVVDSIHQFGIDPNLLIDRFEKSTDSFERVSILGALRHFSLDEIRSKDVDRIIQCVKRVELTGTEEEKLLCKIIRLNIESVETADTVVSVRPN